MSGPRPGVDQAARRCQMTRLAAALDPTRPNQAQIITKLAQSNHNDTTSKYLFIPYQHFDDSVTWTNRKGEVYKHSRQSLDSMFSFERDNCSRTRNDHCSLRMSSTLKLKCSPTRPTCKIYVIV